MHFKPFRALLNSSLRYSKTIFFLPALVAIPYGGRFIPCRSVMNVQSYLDQLGISYRVCHHPIAYTAQDLAAQEHISGKKVIKPVIVRADGELVMCALPASYKIDVEEL